MTERVKFKTLDVGDKFVVWSQGKCYQFIKTYKRVPSFLANAESDNLMIHFDDDANVSIPLRGSLPTLSELESDPHWERR